jgi:Flp pilus assembly protein TadG
MSKRFCCFLKPFLGDENGVTTLIVALAFSALVSSIGVGVDYARAQMTQTKLAESLDAAGLAAGGTISSQDFEGVADSYFRANFPADKLGITVSPLSVVANTDQTVLTLSVTATMPTTFLSLFGKQTMTFNASSEITRKSDGLELVLVMDNTGSMAGQKLTDLKNAATELVDILFGNKTSDDKLWIGLVPFSQAVNIGSSRTAWLDQTQYKSLNWGTTSWAGCVDARQTPRDVTDDPPSAKLFKAYYWPDNNNYNDWQKSNGSSRTGLGSSLGPNKYCPQSVQTLSNQKATVLAGIQTMQAVGNTHIGLGAVWGWRMLSPRWRGLWGGAMDSNNLPLDYNTPHMHKVAIILTDGDNTISSSVRGAYGYLSDGVLGTTNSNQAVTTLNQRLTTTCTAMKNAGITVYTIMFDLTSSTSGALLQGCASKPDYYFSSATGTDLQQAFRQIGDGLSNLRISK